MRKFTYLLKTLLVSAALLIGGENCAWGQTTRTWDFTDNATWSAIAATGYYATDGTESDATAYDGSTAVYMQLDNVSYHVEHWYDIGNGTTTSVSAGVPDKNFVSIKVPAGYTLTVNGCVAGGGTAKSNQLTIRGGEIETYYSSFTFKDIVYVNNTEATITAYIYDPTTVEDRYMRVKTITLTSGIESLTAITENTSWNFTNRAYDFKYGGVIYDNLYYGNGVTQESNSSIILGGTGDLLAGNDYTVQIKIPANQAVGLLINMGGSNGRPSCISDGTNTLFTINATYGGKDTPVNIAPSENERTLYFYNSNYNESYGYIRYIYVYTKQSVNIGDAGWATLYTPCALDFSGTGLTAYTATTDGSTVTLTEVSNVQAGTGVVLKGNKGSYDIPVIGSSSTGKGGLQGAFLTETDADAAPDGQAYYILTRSGDDVQFQPAYGSIPAGKAYLIADWSSGPEAKALRVVFNGEVTGITEMADGGSLKSETEVLYNMSGQIVGKDYKGFVISSKGVKRFQK